MTDIDIKTFLFSVFCYSWSHPYCLRLPSHVDVSRVSISSLYLSPELQSHTNNHYFKLSRPNLNSLPPGPQRAAFRLSPSCMSQSPRAPMFIINHQPLRMLPPHYFPSPSSFSCLITVTVIIIITITIMWKQHRNSFPTFELLIYNLGRIQSPLYLQKGPR